MQFRGGATRSPGADRGVLLVNIAREHGVYGDHGLLFEYELEAAVGRRIESNVDGVSAALLSDLDLDPRLARRPILMAPRTLSLAAHFVGAGPGRQVAPRSRQPG